MQSWVKYDIVNPEDRATNSNQPFTEYNIFTLTANYICYNCNYLHSMIWYELWMRL